MGADEDLELLVRRYASVIRTAVVKVLGRRDEAFADDVVQRVSEALWKQLKREQAIEHPASYLYRCAVRETVRIIKRELDRGEVAIEHAAAAQALDAPPDLQLEARELAEATEEVIAQLDEDRAKAVRAHLAGFSVEEIQAMYGWPYQKARNLIARGIGDLRVQLKQRGVA